jgi:dolichol-phosphate mannosyltransferase
MLSIVVPALNEADNLRLLIPAIYESLKGRDIEVVIVDGNSTDGTRELISDFVRSYPRLRFRLQSGKGFANAVTEGIVNAGGDVIVTMDAENHKPSEIPLLLDKIADGFDLVIGSRFLKGSKVDLQPERLISTRIANKIAEAAFELNVKDTSSGFRAYRADVIKKVVASGIRTEYFSCQVELLEKIMAIGGKIAEVPVHYVRREKGSSKYDIKPALKDVSRLVDIVKNKKIRGIERMMKKPQKTMT